MLQRLVKVASSNGGAASRQGVLSVIGPDVRIVGDIISQGELQVDGQVDGDITCTVLVVGEGAKVSGEVTAEHIKVFGDLKGKLNASVVSIARSAHVTGDVTHEVLEIEAGAFVEGQCIHRASPPKQIEALPAASAPTAASAKEKTPAKQKAESDAAAS